MDALDATDGHALWRAASAEFSEEIGRNESLTAVADLIIGPQNETLIALHERDGTEAWRVPFQGFPYISIPGVRAGVVFVYLGIHDRFPRVLSHRLPRSTPPRARATGVSTCRTEKGWRSSATWHPE